MTAGTINPSPQGFPAAARTRDSSLLAPSMTLDYQQHRELLHAEEMENRSALDAGRSDAHIPATTPQYPQYPLAPTILRELPVQARAREGQANGGPRFFLQTQGLGLSLNAFAPCLAACHQHVWNRLISFRGESVKW